MENSGNVKAATSTCVGVLGPATIHQTYVTTVGQKFTRELYSC